MVQSSYQSKIGNFTPTYEILGRGATGDVIVAEGPNNERVALKAIRSNSRYYTQLHRNMVREIEALRTLDHPHVLKLVDYGLEAQWMEKECWAAGDFIATEIVPNGELFEFLDSPRGAFSEPVTKQLFKQMLSAMSYMHGRGVCHRDLKLENMLVSEQFTVKVADFGFAGKINGNQRLQTKLGTPGYMAPEILESTSYHG